MGFGHRRDRAIVRIVDFKVQPRTVSGRARNAHGAFTERTSWLVRVRTASGAVGEGEAAPLPGYSPDRPEDVADYLRSWAGSTVVLEPDGVRVWPVLPQDTPPSAVFALEQAILTAAAREQGLELREVLGGIPGQPVPVQSLLDDPRTAPTGARVALRQGVRTFKLKVSGARDLKDQLLGYREAVEHGARTTGVSLDRVRLRLDANGTLGPGWEERVVGCLPAAEWVEEPVKAAAAVLPSAGPIPWALDESLVAADPARFDQATEVLGGFVLKPTLLGGFRQCMRWHDLARRLGVPVCVSHCYEIGPGFRGAVDLAAALQRPGEVHGLFPHSFLDTEASVQDGSVETNQTEDLRP